jgi:signal transduction histidine kinase
MAQNKNFSVVRNNSLFQGVNDFEFTLNVNPKDFIVVEDGGIIYQPGDLSDAIYLIIDGEVKLKITDSGSPTIIKKERNEFFGEKETLDNLARKSSAVANKDSILYMIRKNEIISLLQKSRLIKSNLLGEHMELDIEAPIKNEIVFNEPKGKLSDLPFFKNKKDVQVKVETEPENNVKTKDEFPNAENVISESENENQTSILPVDENINVVEEFSPVESEPLPEINNNTTRDINNLEGKLNPPFSDEDKDSFPGIEPEEVDMEQLDSLENSSDFTNPSPTDVNPGILPEIDTPLLINTIRKIFSGLNTEEIFIAIPEALCELINAEHGRLFLIDKEMTEFRTREKKGDEYSTFKLKFTGNLFTESVNENKTIIINNPPAEELEKISSHTDIQNLLIFPLKNKKGNISGILEFNNSKNGIFIDDDVTALTRLAPLINLALENADFIQNLLHSERLISLNKIANFLIQDIRNPIVTIKQYAEHIKKQSINEDILPVLDMIEEQADAVMNLVQTTLRYSEGILISKPITILFSTAMDNILALLAEYVESRDIKLFKKYNGDGLVKLDRKEFYQACFQIAKNACDAMPQGGNFYVIVTRKGESIRIEFKDTGIGIPDSIKDRIFEPFMSHGKEDRTGLGLAIADKIVKEHNGKIWAESDLGEGSAIIIVLPAAD